MTEKTIFDYVIRMQQAEQAFKQAHDRYWDRLGWGTVAEVDAARATMQRAKEKHVRAEKAYWNFVNKATKDD